MKRRDLLRSAVSITAGLLSPPMVLKGRYALQGAKRPYSARTIEIIGRTAVIDLLGLVTLDWSQLAGWQSNPESFTRRDAEKLRSCGVTVFHPAVELNESEPYEAAVRCFESWNRLIAARPAEFLAVRSAADIGLAKTGRRTGILQGLQNSNHLRTTADVAHFYALGQRVSQLTYNQSNLLGCGCGVRRDTGLTPFGAGVISEMNRVGMAVDVSHAGERTTLEAIEASKAPVLVTHANCRALSPHPRCKSDAAIKAMAAKGGVMGLTGIRAFVTPNDRATLEDLLDHYDHVARLAGVEHIAIGTDSDPDGRDAKHRRRWRTRIEIGGFDHPRRLFDLTEGFVRRRYSDSAIELILGGNAARVLRSIWKAA